ncbi:SIR2 family protein [Paraburkholderia sp. 35.1]|uniref:P-loop NTPase n=1 Tax=Paraburkholderia sp. 35.1 TaxID=2991058 RepID=UPI003D259407
MNEDIKAALTTGRLTLFLGAGASKSCKSRTGAPLLDGVQLAEALAAEAALPYEQESLSVVYSAARSKLQSRLDTFLESKFRHARPSPEYLALAEFAWRRIYTLNIDDALDKALAQRSKQNVETFIASDSIKNQDQVFERLDYIKLNGSIDRLSDGIIFSSAEYAKATGKALPWYEQTASDFVENPFLFVGTKLDEPLLKFHIERYKEINGKKNGVSFALTPSVSEIQRIDLASYNIFHISGTLLDFTNWLNSNFKKPILAWDLATESIPQLAVLKSDAAKAPGYAALFENVTLVRPDFLPRETTNVSDGQIRDFYKGFYPTWDDILNQVPAELDVLQAILSALDNLTPSACILPIVGPAGSGKSTALMQVALRLSVRLDQAVYHIAEPVDDLLGTLKAIEEACTDNIKRIYVAIDNLDAFSDDLVVALSHRQVSRIYVIGAERENVWARKTKSKLRRFAAKEVVISEFSHGDAIKLLEKIQEYGSWTRLGKLTPEARIDELMIRSRKQLLIALWEATAGIGYEKIIQKDYRSLHTDNDRIFMLIIGLATVNRAFVPTELLNRTLIQLGLLRQAPSLLENLAGIVRAEGGKYSVRHPIYARYLMDKIVDPILTERAVRALLGAFSIYPAPVIQHISKKEARIYKGIINHNFLRNVLHGKKKVILGLYQSLEKKFERDGMFWLQYGLCYRDFGEDDEALEKLRVACEAYRMPHTEHAFAQQLLIIAPKLDDEIIAFEYLGSARAILLRLDSSIDSDDLFPICTLAEGEVRVVHRFHGDGEARMKAAEYAKELTARLRQMDGDQYLNTTRQRLTSFASSGKWVENSANSEN